MECVLFYLGIPLSLKATNLQLALFMLGLGDAGKSLLMTILKEVMGPYFQTLASIFFDGSNVGAKSKIYNEYRTNPQILYTWLNEPTDKKMDGPDLKI
jgi:hypothetical protein